MAMMSVAIARPEKIWIARIDHSFTIPRNIAATRLVGIRAVVIVVSMPPPFMIMRIVLVMVAVRPMVIVRGGAHRQCEAKAHDQGEDSCKNLFSFQHDEHLLSRFQTRGAAMSFAT